MAGCRHAAVHPCRYPDAIADPGKSRTACPAPSAPAPKLRLSPRRDGAAARAQAQAELANVDDQLDDFLAGVDDLDDRIYQLLADHTAPT